LATTVKNIPIVLVIPPVVIWDGSPEVIMIPEIEEVAFALKVGEISQPFPSKYGYHILLKTGHSEKDYIPFEEIKDSLYARVQQIEKEYLLIRHLAELHKQYAAKIIIYKEYL
jgi:parvulin-like peptidyl-prolyl isomerase